MGNTPSTSKAVAPAVLPPTATAVRREVPEPQPTSIIKATAQRRLKPAQARELALSAMTAIHNPNFLDWIAVTHMLQSGCGFCLSCKASGLADE